MYYTIYKTICKINDKIYVGKHKTDDLNDGYVGSGKLLRRAVKKYGRENFVKEILYVFSTEEEMNAKERELVTEEFCNRNDTYNVCEGGKGGWSYINKSNIRGMKGKTQTNFQKSVARETIKKLHLREDVRLKAIEKLKAHVKLHGSSFKGKKHTDATRKKMRMSHEGKHVGNKNSQYGKVWITNEILSIKIDKNSVLPGGWKYGRKIKRGA